MRTLSKPWTIVALAAACGGSPQEPAATGDYQPLPSDIMTDVVFRPTTNGIKTALLHSDTVYMRQDSARYDLIGVDLQMFDESGQLSATLTAETGEYSTLGQAMVARGNVVLVTMTEERRIETEELHYDPNSRRVWSDVATAMFTKDGVMRGTAFTADDGFRNANVVGYKGPLPGFRMRF